MTRQKIRLNKKAISYNIFLTSLPVILATTILCYTVTAIYNRNTTNFANMGLIILALISIIIEVIFFRIFKVSLKENIKILKEGDLIINIHPNYIELQGKNRTKTINRDEIYSFDLYGQIFIIKLYNKKIAMKHFKIEDCKLAIDKYKKS